jgi:thiamine-phosphate pyrophosphorylase
MPRVDFTLYLVTDRRQTAGRPLLAVLQEALEAGVTAVQLRERDLPTRELLDLAQALRELTRRYGARLLINDRIDLALAVGADGVHLRADSLPVAAARRLLGPARLIGQSAHTVEDVSRAETEGADFAVLGPAYDTPSKRGYGPPLGLRPFEETRDCRIPVFAIGGVTAARVGELRRAGARGIALISSVLAAASPQAAARELLKALDAGDGVAQVNP